MISWTRSARAHLGESIIVRWVWRAKLKSDPSKYYALKQLRLEKEKEGFPVTALREIKILKKLRHPNLGKLEEIVISKRKRIHW